MTSILEHHPIHELEARRCDGFVRGDLVAVASLLSDDLVYVHAPGIVQTKAQLLAFLGTAFRYSALQRRDLAVHAEGNTAWTTGLMKLQGTRLPGGELVASVSFVTQVWVRRDAAWRLALLQSTRLADSAWLRDAPAQAGLEASSP